MAVKIRIKKIGTVNDLKKSLTIILKYVIILCTNSKKKRVVRYLNSYLNNINMNRFFANRIKEKTFFFQIRIIYLVSFFLDRENVLLTF